MKVRITAQPREPEIDGIRLDRFVEGSVRNVSATLANWLIAEGYAEPEMRHSVDEDLDFAGVTDTRHQVDERPRRRSTDR